MPLDPEHSSLTGKEPDPSRFKAVLAENVTRLRTDAKITKNRFALMIKVGRPFLNKIENARVNPRLDVIVRMADALETTPADLLTKHEEEPAPPSPEAQLPGESRSSEVRHSRLF